MDLVIDHSAHDLEQVNYFLNLLVGSKPDPHYCHLQEADQGTMSGFMVMPSKSEVGNLVIAKPRGLQFANTTEGKGQGERGLKELILPSIRGLYYYGLHSD